MKLFSCGGEKFYLRGEPLTECFLRKNDRAAIGDAELFVKPAAKRSIYACDHHRLEVQGSEEKGKMILLKSSPFRIGSAEDNDLVLKSDVVSEHHAEIRIAENGETWIRDLRSLNGTFVNGERLGRQERMLMDSDEVSVAHFDYLFLDRSVIHTRTQFGRKMLIMGVTVVLVMFGFGLFYLSSPKTETVIAAVDFYLFRNEYDAAQHVLEKMPDSRGFQRYEKQYREYLAKIPRYRKIYEATLKFRDDLKKSQWKAAAERYGALEMNNPLAWNPADPNTIPRQKELSYAKELLDILLMTYSLDTSPNTSLSTLQDGWKRLSSQRKALRKEQKNDPEYLAPLLLELKIRLEQLEKNVTILGKIDAGMNDLAGNPDAKRLSEFTQELEQTHRQVTGVVRIYIRELQFLLGTVQKNMSELQENDLALFDLRMPDIKQVALITADDCMKIPQLYRMRQQMEKHLQDQFRCRDDWHGLQRLLGRYDLAPGKFPPEVHLFSDEKLLESTLELAALRKNPAGKIPADYENLFGERYFFEVLQQTVHSNVNLYASDLIPNMKVVPKCILLKDLYRGVSEALLWFGLPQNQWILHGRMAQTRDYYRQLMQTRLQVLQCFENIASRHRNERRYFIARTAYFFLAPVTPEMSEKMKVFAAEWRKFRLKQQMALEEYSPLNLERSRMIRDRIVADGIPGDPVFNWIRNMK